ncbi:hypothetical protein N9195_00180 [bacterium]|nr:hypothetical protein [bacterium]
MRTKSPFKCLTTLLVALCFFVASNPLLAIIDVYTEIEPSEEAEGYHKKLKLRKERDNKLLLTLPKIGGNPELKAWLVICDKPRGKGHRNFRYEVHWRESKANKSDIQLVVPISFDDRGNANLHLSVDLASRSYVVFGGYFDDGTFSTVNLPAFLEAIDLTPKGEQGGAEQPAAALESKSEGEKKPSPEAEGRSQ